MDRPVIYTIGHSTHQVDYFLVLLKTYSITCIIDVRSVAASSYNPQYNKEPFSNFLQNNGIAYLHFAEEFGARHADPDLLDKVKLTLIKCANHGFLKMVLKNFGWNWKRGLQLR